ncbi:hypothetical protein ILYODFUR_032602 [Ilyodon furcidens]|uniref:Uncharacterized protein n=1 Tax=Ilyodon furcidens TaxID=33524 RepID=A0ABV0TZQ0_9TELE
MLHPQVAPFTFQNLSYSYQLVILLSPLPIIYSPESQLHLDVAPLPFCRKLCITLLSTQAFRQIAHQGVTMGFKLAQRSTVHHMNSAFLSSLSQWTLQSSSVLRVSGRSPQATVILAVLPL